MFVDELKFVVRGGRGGDGCASFRREKFVPRGGPDGGDGGDGGNVILVTSPHENTLYHLAGRRVYEAGKGVPGGSRACTGGRGKDLTLEVPIGTVVIDAERGHPLRDLKSGDDRFVVASGGRGGKGNIRFATATNRAPRQCESGQDGEEREITLSLRLIADVGLVGLPNAGKSTLLSSLSEARPRVADYPFTTLEPSLGIVPLGGNATTGLRNCVMADIPGLIEGAHEGKGLGDKFLKHLERTRVLLHMVDCLTPATEAWQDVQVIRAELAGYSQALAERPCVLVATKVETDEALANARELAELSGDRVVPISAATGRGLDSLRQAIIAILSTPATATD